MQHARFVSVLSIVLSSAAIAQSPMPAPAFAAASIKPNDAGGNRVDVTPGTLTIHSGTLVTCITWAYDVSYSQVLGANAEVSRLLDSERYDIVAKAASRVPDNQLKQMLQTLLADRFKLALHRQSKEMQVYTLEIAKSGPKLHESEGEGESKQQAKSKLARQWAWTTMSQFADDISGAMDAPVLDRTELSGKYDFSLDLTPYIPADLQPGQRPDLAVMMRSAVQELGLRLESRKAPRDVLVVDHLEKASEN